VNALRDFLSAYFHEDWPDDGSDDRAIVAAYQRKSSAEERGRVCLELARLLSRGLDDQQLRRILLDDLGCYFSPRGSAAQWLAEVQDMLRRAE